MHWFNWVLVGFFGITFGWFIGEAIDKRTPWAITKVAVLGFLFVSSMVFAF